MPSFGEEVGKGSPGLLFATQEPDAVDLVVSNASKMPFLTLSMAGGSPSKQSELWFDHSRENGVIRYEQ